MTVDAFTFFHPFRARWNECDAQGIVFNVNYLLYVDIGIWEYTRALGYGADNAPEFVTARSECDYRAPARFDDELRIGVRCARLGTRSVVKAFVIIRHEETLAEGRMTYVAVKRGTTATRTLEPDYVERILAFEGAPPERGQGRS